MKFRTLTSKPSLLQFGHSDMSDSCDPMDCSPPGSSAHETLQARILEWAVMPCSRGSPHPGIKPVCLLCLRHWQAGSLPLGQPGKPPSSCRNPQYKSVVFPLQEKGLSAFILGCTHFRAIFDLDMSNQADESQGWSQIWLQRH